MTQAAAQDVLTFFQTHRDQAADNLMRVGGAFTIQVGPHVLRADENELEQRLREGQLAADTVLLRSLLVYEAAVNAYLHQSVATSILGAYRQAVADGVNAASAQHDCYANVALAYDVEAYLNHKAGLSRDMRQVSDFTHEAIDAARMAAGITDDADDELPEATTEAIVRQQETLDAALHCFMDAVADAKETGQYAKAFDAQQDFFRKAMTIAATEYWRKRSQTLNREISLAETVGAIARSRAKLSHLAETIADRQT